MRQRSIVSLLAGVMVAGLGCYGSTEPATDVHPNGGTLQARGTADNGPASSYFEYWKTATPDQKARTAIKQFPAGASGPISVPVQFLTQGTSYSYRACGWDGQQPQPPPSTKCAQTRTFSTPPGDAVDAQIAYDSRLKSGLHLHAWSKPDGSSASSSFFEDGGTAIGTFAGRVTCLAVQSNRAAIGGVGTFTTPQGSKEARTDLVTLARDSSGSYTVGTVLTPGTTPPNCATASFANQFTPFVASVLVQSG